MGTIFRLSMSQLSGKWRLSTIAVLALLPIVMATLVASLADADEAAEIIVQGAVDGLILATTLPLIIVVLATAAFANEVEDRTLSYLTLKPIGKTQIVLPKVAASIMIGGPFLVASAVAVVLIGLEGDVQAALAVGVAVLIGIVAYASIFTWAGLMTTRALAFGVMYVFLWEGLITSFLSGTRFLSVRAYAETILHELDEEAFAVLGDRVIQFPAAVVGAAGVTVIFFALAVRRLRRMDVP